MQNAQIADTFSLLAKLMDIHGENSFKSKNYANAAFQIDKLPEQLHEMPPARWAGLRGIGTGTAARIGELIQTGTLAELEALLQATPPGVLDLLQIKGLGAKKIHTIWKEMEIESMGELLYACNENRLILYKGFSEKTQNNVREAILFAMAQQGKFLYQQAEALSETLRMAIEKLPGVTQVFTAGAMRRCEDVIEKLSYVVAGDMTTLADALEHNGYTLQSREGNTLHLQVNGAPAVELLCTAPAAAGLGLLQATGPEAFTAWVQAQLDALPAPAPLTTEGDVFAALGIAPVAPQHRGIFSQKAYYTAHVQQAPASADSIRGIIHSHSTWSDGSHTPAAMAQAAIARGWEYLVLSDHSMAASYAGGLTPDRVRAQHAEIDALNAQLQPFRIFKSIECDILGNGDLDYDEEVLQSFDVVIASIHSTLRMSEEKAMQRLLKAIENPYTNILGHMTGRLLLSRNGYPIQHTKIIDACAANDVVIEINAHPRRLDLDHTWIPYALEKGVLLSINPDAHSIEGFEDIRYGAIAASKALLPASRNLSSFTLAEFTDWLMHNRQTKGTL